jgi:hypothetical protein
VEGGKGGRLDIAVSLSKNIRRNPKDGYFYLVDSQLWLYRRKGSIAPES